MNYSQPGIIIATDPLVDAGNITGCPQHRIGRYHKRTTEHDGASGLIALANAMCDNTSGATYGTTIVIPGHSTPPGTRATADRPTGLRNRTPKK